MNPQPSPHLTTLGIVAAIALFLSLSAVRQTAYAIIIALCMLILLVLLVNYKQTLSVFVTTS